MEKTTQGRKSSSSDALQDFAAYLSHNGLSQGTVRNYLSDLRKFQRWLGRSKGEAFSLFEIASPDINEYLCHLRAEEGRLDTTTHRNLEAIRSFCRFAVEAGYMISNPAGQVKFSPARRRTSPRALTDKEVSRILEAVRRRQPGFAARDYAILQVLLETGIRLGELASLRLSDVQLGAERAALIVREGKAGGPRQIPLSRAASEAIEAYMEVRNPLPGVEHLFLTRDGKPLSMRAVQRILAVHSRAAGLKNVSANTLRNTHAKRLLENTGNLALVAKRLGHTRLETTVKYITFGQGDRPENVKVEEGKVSAYEQERDVWKVQGRHSL